MAKYSYGLTSFKMGDIAAADGSLENEVELIKGIYKSTMTYDEAEGTTTDHYVEGVTDPVVSIDEGGKTTIDFTFIDLAAEQKERFMGGTVTKVDLKDTWSKPLTAPSIFRYIKYTLKDGTVVELPKVKVVGRLTGKIGAIEISAMAVKLTVLTPDFGLKSVIFTDPV